MATTIVPLSGPGTTIIPTGGPSSIDPALGVNQSNLVRYAVGQPTLVDTNGYVNSWSYDEDTGTLSVTYNAMPTTIGPDNGPHFQWELFGFDGTSISGLDANSEAHFLILPVVTDISYSGSGSDRPSVGAGLSNTIGSLDRGLHAMWNQTGPSRAGASLVYYLVGSYVNKTGLDTAPTGDGIGAILTYDPQATYGFNGTAIRGPRSSIIQPAGDYDSGLEATANVGLLDYIYARYLDVFLGCAEWSGGTGSVPAGETISMTVAAVALPFFPRFLGSNFIKQP